MENKILYNFESGYPDHNDSSNGELLRDIEEISRALSLESKTQKDSLVLSSNLGPRLGKNSDFNGLRSKRKPGFEDVDRWLREKKKGSSIWDWKPFKALSHIRHKKFLCCFFCHVHCIENLSSDLGDISMSVQWKRKDNVLRTLPSRVLNGMVEFEETLMSKCTVYGAKNGPGNFVKYEPKHFLLYASIIGAEGLDIGKHWVDLTRLLPLTLEDLEEDKCSGKWSTSFKLSGKAKGAKLHVSFGFLVTKDGLAELGSNINLPLILNLERNSENRMSFVADYDSGKGTSMLRRVGSVPSSLTNASSNSSPCLDVKLGWSKDVSFSNSISMLYGKLEEESIDCPAKFDMVLQHLESLKLAPNLLSGSVKDFSGSEHDDTDFTVIDKGVELECSAEDEKKLDESTVEVIDIAEIFYGEGISSHEETKSNRKDEVSSCVANDILIDRHSVVDIKQTDLEQQVLDLHKMYVSDPDRLELLVDEMSDEIMVKHNGSKPVKSLSLDDVANAVADDFFNLLQETQTPSIRSFKGDLESPRESLLRQFEEDMMASGSFFLDVDVQEDEAESDYAALNVTPSDYDFESIDFLPVFDT